MTEKQIEQYFCDQVRIKLKGIAYKFTSPGRRSVPDRICVVPGYCFFVECKATNKFLTGAQEREKDRLKSLDQWVYAVNSKFQVRELISHWVDKLERKGYL